MTRETAKKNLEIIKAYAEGKKIQMLSDSGTWEINDNPLFMDNCEYRIKPEPKYVPWTVENCPLKCGDVLLYKDSQNLQVMITGTDFQKDETDIVRVNGAWYTFKGLFELYVMADGTPCGEKVEA